MSSESIQRLCGPATNILQISSDDDSIYRLERISRFGLSIGQQVVKLVLVLPLPLLLLLLCLYALFANVHSIQCHNRCVVNCKFVRYIDVFQIWSDGCLATRWIRCMQSTIAYIFFVGFSRSLSQPNENHFEQKNNHFAQRLYFNFHLCLLRLFNQTFVDLYSFCVVCI